METNILKFYVKKPIGLQKQNSGFERSIKLQKWEHLITQMS